MPCLRRGKKYDVLGMKPEKAPPPMPDRNARIRNVVKVVDGFWTAMPHPTSGISSRAVVSVTSLRVPMTGGSHIQTRRSEPPARPGMAVSQ